MRSSNILVIGSIIFFIGFIIAIISTISFGTHLDIEAYNLWTTLSHISMAIMIIGTIIAVPVSLLFTRKEKNSA